MKGKWKTLRAHCLICHCPELCCMMLLQVEDQSWTKGNMCLKISFEQAAPVRVCRGSGV